MHEDEPHRVARPSQRMGRRAILAQGGNRLAAVGRAGVVLTVRPEEVKRLHAGLVGVHLGQHALQDRCIEKANEESGHQRFVIIIFGLVCCLIYIPFIFALG